MISTGIFDGMVRFIQGLKFPPDVDRHLYFDLENEELVLVLFQVADPESRRSSLHFAVPMPDLKLREAICHGMECLYDDDELCEPKTGVIDTTYMGTDV